MESMSMKHSMKHLHKSESDIGHGGMYKHVDTRHDRNGVEIKAKRERQPNGQKKRLPHKVLFADQCVVDKESETKHSLETVI